MNSFSHAENRIVTRIVSSSFVLVLNEMVLLMSRSKSAKGMKIWVLLRLERLEDYGADYGSSNDGSPLAVTMQVIAAKPLKIAGLRNEVLVSMASPSCPNLDSTIDDETSSEHASEHWYSITLSNFETLEHRRAFESVAVSANAGIKE